MGLDSNSKNADAVGNLYRSALFMTKGQTRLSITFLEKTYRVLGKKLPKQVIYFMKKKENLTKKQQLHWAEKILDCYHLLKRDYLLPRSFLIDSP